jgi:hypothetical protein
MDTAETSGEQSLADENQVLRSRVAALEAELVEVQSRTDAAVGQWQERAYWLDRWHLDLNALMRRPGAAELRTGVRAVRSLIRALRRAKRSVSRS